MRGLTMALCLAALSTPALAQDAEDMIAQLEAAQAQAQADAVRPGDEALTCEQLEAEITATMQSPEMAAFTAQQSAFAASQMEQVEANQNAMMGQMGLNMALGLASAFIPGLGYAQQGMMMAQQAQMEGQVAENMARMTEMTAPVQAMMPMLMRAQRVQELAQAQQCAFAQDPPAAPAEMDE